MADSKISALPAASTPLAGTEVLPIVQGGATKQVSVASLTAGRSPSMNYAVANNGVIIQNGGVNRWFIEREAGAGDGLFIYRYNDDGSYAGNPLQISRSNGNVRVENNLVIGTSGNGIDFSATSGTGTSELFSDYEEGTWSPSYVPETGSFTTISYGTATGVYTKIGRTVTVRGQLFVSALNTAGASGALAIGGLPYAPQSAASVGVVYNAGDGGINYNDFNVLVTLCTSSSASKLYLAYNNGNHNSQVQVSNMGGANGDNLIFTITYQV